MTVSGGDCCSIRSSSDFRWRRSSVAVSQRCSYDISMSSALAAHVSSILSVCMSVDCVLLSVEVSWILSVDCMSWVSWVCRCSALTDDISALSSQPFTISSSASTHYTLHNNTIHTAAQYTVHSTQYSHSFIHSFISVIHHYEHIAPNVDINLQSGRFWATSVASFRERFIQVLLGSLHPRSTGVSRWSPPLLQ